MDESIYVIRKYLRMGAYTNHVDQAGGRGGFQIVHVSPQGGGGLIGWSMWTFSQV